MVRLVWGWPLASLKVKFVPLRPMRSTFPSIRRRSGRLSYSANRMLEEPPLIARSEVETRIASTGLRRPATSNARTSQPTIDKHSGNLLLSRVCCDPPIRIRNDGRFTRLAMDVNPPELRYLLCWMRSSAQEKSDNAPKLKLHLCWLVDCA